MITKRPGDGMLVSFEGVSSVGKTFISKRVAAEDPNIITISDSPEDPLHQDIEQALNNEHDFFNRHGYPPTEALLFMSRRLVELQNQVIPKLEAGQTVIHDRSFYSPCIYPSIIQAEHRPGKTVTEYFEEYSRIQKTLSFEPDLNILFMDEFETCKKRLQTLSDYILDESEKDLFQQVHEWFPELLTRLDNTAVVDISDKSVDEVVETTTTLIHEHD